MIYLFVYAPFMRCQMFPFGSKNALEPDVFPLNRHRTLIFCLSMIFSEKRFPLFGIRR